MSFQVLGLVRDLYDSRQMRYVTVETLSEDVMTLARTKLSNVQQQLNKAT